MNLEGSQGLEFFVVSSSLGVIRSAAVDSLLHPLTVIGIRRQCTEPCQKIRTVAFSIFQEGGIRAFYNGLIPQLLKNSFKPIWCLPLITGLPPFFEKSGADKLSAQALTGFGIASIDAVVSTPFERLKITSIAGGKAKSFNLVKFFQEGWTGVGVHWLKLSVNWMTFLTAQEYLKNRSKSSPDQLLSYPELIKVGIQVSFVVSTLSAPFDIANTLKQVEGNVKSMSMKKYFGNLPLIIGCRTLQTITTITAIDLINSMYHLKN